MSGKSHPCSGPQRSSAAKVYAERHGQDSNPTTRRQRLPQNRGGQQRRNRRNQRSEESFFSRIQRAYADVHHRFSTRYFDWYVADLAWKEDARWMSNGA
ncbi:transposase [Microvirga makkahensis]|uniref:ISXO2-like transposase domain-containing protein n=1 Tax=Microvirga makkahensis TaxID=1128670 RepID=A0A7X3SRP6_9HYPH|nr:hypothetical protein [Microvirga makkahensis]